MDEVSEGLSAGRETLDAILREVRAHARCRHVVLHDDRAFAFPLADASGIAVIELVRETVAADSDARQALRPTLNRLRGQHRFRNLAGYPRADPRRVRHAREAGESGE